jgi:hypothetical protein
VRGDARTAEIFLSHNFKNNDPSLKAFRKGFFSERPDRFEIGPIESELALRKVVVVVYGPGGRSGRNTYWIFERDDWFLEVLD